MAEKFKFGQTLAADYVPEEYNDAVWIRTFKDGSTQIRIVPAEGLDKNGEPVYGADAWPTQREHYDPALKLSYGCINDLGSSECVGCASNIERVRKRSRYYYVNAFDKDNELRVYKFGIKVFNTLLSRQQRLTTPENRQPLSDRDIIVTRMGKDFNEISYDVDWGEKYPVDFPEEVHDISAILGEAFEEAMEKYESGEPLKEEEEKPNPAADKTGAAAKKTAAKRTSPSILQQTRASQKAESNGSSDDTSRLGELPSEDELMDADTGELKRWLKNVAHADFPATAPRSRLIKIAKDHLAIPY